VLAKQLGDPSVPRAEPTTAAPVGERDHARSVRRYGEVRLEEYARGDDDSNSWIGHRSAR
jgi:hypothetical protein